MATYSTNLALTLMATGEQSNTWGDTTNTNLGTLLEQAISGYVTQAITDGADTTITIPNGASGVARNMYLELTGALTAARNLIVPTNKKLYFVHNNTTGGFAVTVKVSGQTGVSVPNGKKVILVSNFTDIVDAVNYFSSASTGALTVTSLTDSGLTSGRVTFAGASGLLSDSANLTFNGTILTAAGLSGPFNGTVGASTPAAATVTTLTASADSSFTSTGAVKIPASTTGNRPAGTTGQIRYNTTLNTFEGYGASSWGSIGGGATGAGGDTVFQENQLIVTTSYTLSTGKSAMSVGPITINASVAVTVPSGYRWVVL